MISNEMTIAELYNCNPIENAEFSLQLWYNDVIKKRPSQITIKDNLIMLRQQLFCDTAVSCALSELSHDPFAGELWDGQLFEQLIKTDITYLKPHKIELQELYSVVKKYNKHEWLSNDERKRFVEVVNNYPKLLEKL